MLPLVRPALIVVAVFSILYTWHDFFGPLIYLQDQSIPLSLGLFAFRSQRTDGMGADHDRLDADRAAADPRLPLHPALFPARRGDDGA